MRIGITINAPDNPAEILEVTQPQYLTEKDDDTSTLLFLQANAPDKVEPATIEIRPPSKILTPVQSSSEQIALELESHFLKYNRVVSRNLRWYFVKRRI